MNVPAKEISSRVAALQQRLRETAAGGLLVVQRTDLYYLSGTAQFGWLYLPAAGEPLLCVRRHAPRAREESPLVQVAAVDSVREIPDRIRRACGRIPPVVAFELDVLPVGEFEFYRRLLGVERAVDGSPLLLACRTVKSEWEIERLEAAAAMTARTFEYMRCALRPGMSEMEFAGRFECFARALGHGGQLRVRHHNTEGYPWHVLSGPEGARPGILDSPASGTGTSPAFPCGAGSRRMQPGEPIMVDFAAVKNGYHMDETRMFAMGGMPADALRASQAALRIHDELIDAIRPGAACGDIFARGLRAARNLGVGDAYLGAPGHKVDWVAHGIGLELVEPPLIARGRETPLAAGMVLAIEPKLVVENRLVAGVESVVRVTPAGARMVSRVPAEIFIC